MQPCITITCDENKVVTVSHKNGKDETSNTYSFSDFQQVLDSKAFIEDTVMYLKYGE